MKKFVLAIAVGLAIVLVLLLSSAGLMLANGGSIRAYTTASLLQLLVLIEAIVAVGILFRSTLHGLRRSRA
jgi:hypothetical protein